MRFDGNLAARAVATYHKSVTRFLKSKNNIVSNEVGHGAESRNIRAVDIGLASQHVAHATY